MSGGKSMGNLKTWNNFHILDHNNSQKSNLLKDTQCKLKSIKNGEYDIETVRLLPEKILNSMVKSIFEGLPPLDNVCSEIQWLISPSESNDEEVNMEKFDWQVKLIKQLQAQDDFIKAYIFNETNQVNLWIVIAETGLDKNLKYIKLCREYECKYNCDFSIILFEEDEEKEILEQISFITAECKEVTKDGK